MYALLFLMPMQSEAEMQDLRDIIAQARVRAIIEEIKQPQIQQTYSKETYEELRQKAINLNKPLIVVVRYKNVEENSDYLYYYCDEFNTVKRPGIVVSLPINGNLWWLRTLDIYDVNEIQKILKSRISTYTPAINQIPFNQIPFNQIPFNQIPLQSPYQANYQLIQGLSFMPSESSSC